MPWPISYEVTVWNMLKCDFKNPFITLALRQKQRAAIEVISEACEQFTKKGNVLITWLETSMKNQIVLRRGGGERGRKLCRKEILGVYIRCRLKRHRIFIFLYLLWGSLSCWRGYQIENTFLVRWEHQERMFMREKVNTSFLIASLTSMYLFYA